jgi:hypothetical protein
LAANHHLCGAGTGACRRQHVLDSAWHVSVLFGPNVFVYDAPNVLPRYYIPTVEAAAHLYEAGQPL